VAVWVGRPEDITRVMPAFAPTLPDDTIALPGDDGVDTGGDTR
jgi:hypothetical protein